MVLPTVRVRHPRVEVEVVIEDGFVEHVFESAVEEKLRTGRLRRVPESYAPTVSGFFLYFPSRAQRSALLRLFVETIRALAVMKGIK
ncbi:hypothetical protein OV427_39675 [Pyxidicoccus sp. MSG2]|nr:hypothetical protein [Pyxidicoccus sp. MSG2]MCY1021932.1 hypothetical protein [Pyxidicoccus sp. MSG2]